MDSTLSVNKKIGIYIPALPSITVRAEGREVAMLLEDSKITMGTVAAHAAGFKLVRLSGTAISGELIVLKINGDELDLLPEQAKSIGGALLRKADKADDFQRYYAKRKIS